MFKWLTWFRLKDCGLNLFIINWLGIEKESLLTDHESINWEQHSQVNPKINSQN